MMSLFSLLRNVQTEFVTYIFNLKRFNVTCFL